MDIALTLRQRETKKGPTLETLDFTIHIYKISCVLRTLWLVSYCVYIRLCKHGCDVTAYFLLLFYIRNRKWTPYSVYITWWLYCSAVHNSTPIYLLLLVRIMRSINLDPAIDTTWIQVEIYWCVHTKELGLIWTDLPVAFTLDWSSSGLWA